MSIKKRSSKKQWKVPVRFEDRVFGNLSKKRMKSEAEVITEDARVEEEVVEELFGGNDEGIMGELNGKD
ncbi:hypothetical protein Tco_0563068, partial [Tanacetum coccineum]